MMLKSFADFADAAAFEGLPPCLHHFLVFEYLVENFLVVVVVRLWF